MSQAISLDDLEKLLHGITIPSPPQVLADIQMELALPDTDIRTLADLIEQDAGLSGGVLKTVNSPIFSAAPNVSSIREAVNILGIDLVINILNSLSLRSEMAQSSLTEESVKFLVYFWDSASDIAMVSSLIAKRVGFKSPDQAYMLGLFHNAGIPLLMSRFTNYLTVLQEAYSGSDQRIIDTENRLVDTNHAVVGFYIGKSWKLPRALCDAIARHHSIAEVFAESDDDDSELKDLLAILKIAEHVVGLHRIVSGQPQDYEWEKIADYVLSQCGLSEDEIEDITSQAQDLGIGVLSYYQ